MEEFSVDLERGRHHSVTIQSRGLDLPLVDINISARAALGLLQALLDKEKDLHDMAMHYYDCPDCGYTHKKGEKCAPGEDENA